MVDSDFSDIQTKNPKTVVVVIVTILIMLVLQVGGYFVYKEFFHDRDEEITEDQTEAPILEITASEQNAMMERLEAYLFFANFFPISNMEIIDNQEIIRFALFRLDENASDLTKSNVEAIVNTYFGERPYLELTNIYCPVDGDVMYAYDEELEIFERQPGHNHNFIRHRADFEFISGTRRGEEFTITVQMLFFAPCIGTCGPLTAVYAMPHDARADMNRILAIPNRSSREITEMERAEALESLVETEFVFRRVGTNFILQSMNMQWEPEEWDIE